MGEQKRRKREREKEKKREILETEAGEESYSKGLPYFM